jgi:hypothetical protein
LLPFAPFLRKPLIVDAIPLAICASPPGAGTLFELSELLPLDVDALFPADVPLVALGELPPGWRESMRLVAIVPLPSGEPPFEPLRNPLIADAIPLAICARPFGAGALFELSEPGPLDASLDVPITFDVVELCPSGEPPFELLGPSRCTHFAMSLTELASGLADSAIPKPCCTGPSAPFPFHLFLSEPNGPATELGKPP